MMTLANILTQNIDFQTTILSRFDMIFIVRDEHNENRDKVRLKSCAYYNC